jgi:hypothetical protein
VIVFRVVQNSESNDLYPPVFHFCMNSPFVFNSIITVDVSVHAKWMQLAQNCVHWRALVLVVLNLLVLASEG